jgi:hypothetical protein
MHHPNCICVYIECRLLYPIIDQHFYTVYFCYKLLICMKHSCIHRLLLLSLLFVEDEVDNAASVLDTSSFLASLPTSRMLFTF